MGFMDCYTKRYNPKVEGYGNRAEWKSAFRERMGTDEAEEYLRTEQPTAPCLEDLRKCKTLVELKSVYRALMKIHHPDMGGDKKIAQGIIATYTILSNKLK